MRVYNEKLSKKIWYILSSIVLLLLMAVFLTPLILLNKALLLDIIFIGYFLFIAFVLVKFVVYSLGYYIIDETGITQCFLFYKRHYNWYDFKFITKSREVFRKIDNDRHYHRIARKIIVSVEIPIEDFTKKHMRHMFSDKFFYMPYSKALEEYIITKAPVRCYIDSYIVDEDPNGRYN